MASPAGRKTLGAPVALVGSETLAGREILEMLQQQANQRTVLEFAANAEGNFGEQDGEAVYLQALEPDAVRSVSAVIVAGSADGAQKAYEQCRASGGATRLLDVTGILEDKPEAEVASGLLDRPPAQSWLTIVAHPVASALALLVERVGAHAAIQRSMFQIFEPASESGKAGVEELQRQTTNLLAFRPLPTEVFGAQLSFSLLPVRGEEAAIPLASIEQRIERHLATLMSRSGAMSRWPTPSLRLVQAPVFHSYAVSGWLELDRVVEGRAIEEAVASAQIEVRGATDAPPTNVGAAGQTGLTVGDVRADRNNPRAVWVWVVFDNLRLVAEAVAALLNQALPGRNA